MPESFHTEPEGEVLLSEAGLGGDALLAIHALHATNRIRKDTVNTFYEPFIEPEIADLHRAIQLQGHDLFSAFGYEGTATYLDQCIRELERSFMGWNNEFRGGTVLPSATIAVQHALQIALTEFSQSIDHDYSVDGLPPSNKPVVLAPIHANFLLERVCRASGLGSSAVRYYDLDPDYVADLDSVRQVLFDCARKNETVVLNFMFGGGDTLRGLPQDTHAILNTIENYADKRPFHLVDGASHFFNAWAVEILDMSDSRIDAAVANPQKNGFPLGGTLFFLRDARRLGSLAGEDHSALSSDSFETQRLRIQAQGTWLISRDASAAMTFFAALARHGTDWFRSERLRAHGHANYFRKRLQDYPDIFGLIPSGNTIVAFFVRGRSSANRMVAEAINHSNEAFIGYDPVGMVRNPQELHAAREQHRLRIYTDYDCLWANFYAFQTQDDVERFLVRVRDAASLVLPID